MSLKDKLEIGLKPEAPYRPDNLPEFQKDDPACQVAAEPGDGPDQAEARDDCGSGSQPKARRKVRGSQRSDGVNHQ
jgi:hypothetical protein